MKKWTTRLALAFGIASGFGVDRLPAQDVLPATANVLVVPNLDMEPARPQVKRPSGITTVGFLQPEETQSTLMPIDVNPPPAPSDPLRCWVRADYLRWHISAAPVSAPFVSTNTPPAIGALNEAGTTILFGAGSGRNVDFGPISGARATIGGWLEDKREANWELSGFVLARSTFTFNAASLGGAAPIVSIPFNATQPFNGNPAGETALNSGGAPASAHVQLTSQLWGVELNETVYLTNSRNFYWAALFGFRYLGLNENMTLTYTTLDTTNNGNVAVTDGFSTRNIYCGGQFGFRLGFEFDRWNIDAAAMCAFGNNHQLLDIGGSTVVTGGAFGFANGATPGGVFAQPSNLGGISRDMFAYVPELSAKVGFAFTPNIVVFGAYNALFISNVARPGNQVDRNINPTQSTFFVPPGTVTGVAVPVPVFNSSSMWAHGLQIGMEIRY